MRRYQISSFGETDESISNQQGTSVQSTAGSRSVRISGSNAGYTMFRGSVKCTGYLLHSPVPLHIPSRSSLYAITFQLDSTHRTGGWFGLGTGPDRKSHPTGIRTPYRPARGESLCRSQSAVYRAKNAIRNISDRKPDCLVTSNVLSLA